MEKRTVHTEKRTYEKYDEKHYLLYLNEEVIKDYEPKFPEPDAEPLAPCTAYAYTGDQADGSTMVEAAEATYDAFVSGLIRRKYSADKVEAITLNKLGSNTERQAEFDAEFAALETYRNECKAKTRKVLGMDTEE